MRAATVVFSLLSSSGVWKLCRILRAELERLGAGLACQLLALGKKAAGPPKPEGGWTEQRESSGPLREARCLLKVLEFLTK